MREPYMRTGEGFLLVYSTTSRVSFDEISNLHQLVLKMKESDPFTAFIVGNKCDLEYEREVGINGEYFISHLYGTKRLVYPEGRHLAHSLNCKFIETSAKERVNVDEIFHNLVREIRKSNN